MKDPEQSVVFAGVDGRTDSELPPWYEADKNVKEPVSFAEAVRSLPKAMETTVGYENPITNEWMETERFNAIVEPSRLHSQAVGEDVEPLFHVPSNSYSIINPCDVYGPLEDVLRETDYEETPLGELVFGEIRQYRGGGEVHMDVLFDGLSVELCDDRNPITIGFSSGYDFFGGHAVYVEGFAQDSYCSNSIRQLTERESVKHIGDIRNFTHWWRDLLDQLELVANDLLDFPDYLAQHARDDARAEAADPFEIDMWTLHSGATHALTHFYTGREGAALDGYVRTANDILFNPERTLSLVRDHYEQQAEANSEGGQGDLESQVALAQIDQVSQDIQSKAAEFEQRQEMLRNRFEQAAQ